ncbi:MAG TPA: M48 family metallopeptidase [Isosphaeraceae bacterium]|jgi:Zn-dependent protease with chaperone function|nr:M48 family metallopeptidase [Isosphaeraceae bacterium]
MDGGGARSRPGRGRPGDGVGAPGEAEARPVGPLNLALRRLGLRGLELAYRAGVATGSAALLVVGGLAPVLRGWLRDEIDDWGDVVEALGGVRVVAETTDPDADYGPVIAYADAPVLFAAIGEVARRLGVRPPEQVRLAYLPCCGVVAWRRTRALMLGLPLLHVLNLAELRAVLAHELAHLARGDATRAVRSARFVAALGRALDRREGRARGPLHAWARFCHRRAAVLLEPISRGQEARADRLAAAIAGGDAAAAALVKVALVQPLFREVLDHYDPTDPDLPNLYAFFRSFWNRLPEPLQTSMRLRVLAGYQAPRDPAHPPLPDRLAIVQSYPRRNSHESSPVKHPLGDLEPLEQMLHNRLFGGLPLEPTVFHRAGT